jgi:hypothetical protein
MNYLKMRYVVNDMIMDIKSFINLMEKWLLEL